MTTPRSTDPDGSDEIIELYGECLNARDGVEDETGREGARTLDSATLLRLNAALATFTGWLESLLEAAKSRGGRCLAGTGNVLRGELLGWIPDASRALDRVDDDLAQPFSPSEEELELYGDVIHTANDATRMLRELQDLLERSGGDRPDPGTDRPSPPDRSGVTPKRPPGWTPAVPGAPPPPGTDDAKAGATATTGGHPAHPEVAAVFAEAEALSVGGRAGAADVVRLQGRLIGLCWSGAITPVEAFHLQGELDRALSGARGRGPDVAP